MLFSWNDETARWMLDASDYTGYNKKLAELLLAHIPCRDTLCDIGCGMGLVDFELAPAIRRITCADIDETAVGFVRDRAAALGADNIDAVHADGLALEGQWDTVMALFHSDVADMCVNYLRKARDRLIVVTHGSAFSSVGPAKYHIRKCCDIDSTAAWLDENGFRYTAESCALEFGQPHRSLADAVKSAAAFSKGIPEDELLAYVKETARATGREDFPLYTPKNRRFGLFVIPREGNEDKL